ncbi:HPr kinase [Salinisphaera sp. PC39]|uniref:HPr(Ser) kinase/phosphatase n=1 Tax=Salinisphaera sp. PC39 TaxID=1304156 RepID=UPI00333F0C8B
MQVDNAEISVARIHAQVGEALQWRWRREPAGGDRPLRTGAMGRGHVPMVGYFNFIHPPRVQVVGAPEADYLAGADPAERRRILARVAAADTAMMVLADDCRLEDAWLDPLHDAGIAVFDTAVSAHRVAYRLRHFLGRALARQVTIHGVFMEILSLGVLLTGEPAVGKSELALELISRGHRLVADDAPEFALLGPDDLNGGCPPLLQDFLEVRGLGILNIRAMFGEAAIKRRKQLGLIVNLVRPTDPALPVPDRLGGSRRTRDILEVRTPEITLPVAAGHNLAVLVEAACRDHLLRMQGYAGDEAFAERQAAALDENGRGEDDSCD